MFVFETGQLAAPYYIINFPTKRRWRGKSRIEDIESGLTALVETIVKYDIQSISLPPLGSGLGGLDWSEVKNRIEQTLEPLANVRVIVYEPKGAPNSKTMVHSRKAPNMTTGRAALVGLIDQYFKGLLDPSVTLLEVHKLMYFMQESGEDLRLNYTKHHYGPYANNLRHVLNAIEGHLVSGYADGGDNPRKRLKLVPQAIQDSTEYLEQHPDTLSRFSKVVDLVEGFESPFGLELLSTVYWVIKNENARTVEDVINHTYSWNKRKKQFSKRQIALAIKTLSDKGWIENWLN